jgi:hypothetical protein
MKEGVFSPLKMVSHSLRKDYRTCIMSIIYLQIDRANFTIKETLNPLRLSISREGRRHERFRVFYLAFFY